MDRIRGEHLMPDFVILDWQLSGRTSSELLRYLASTPKFVRARIIVLTEHSTDIPQLCVSAVLPKTIAPSEVLAMMDKLTPPVQRASG